MSSLSSRECHRDRAGDPFGMQMRHLGRPDRLGDNHFGIVRVVRAQRCDPHGRTIAARTLAIERGPGRLPPDHAVPYSSQCPDRCEAIVAVRLIPSGETSGQSILFDATVVTKFCHYAASHFGVVGPRPLSGRRRARHEIRKRLAHREDLRAQRITNGQPVERIEHQADMRHVRCGSPLPPSHDSYLPSTRALRMTRSARLLSELLASLTRGVAWIRRRLPPLLVWRLR